MASSLTDVGVVTAAVVVVDPAAATGATCSAVPDSTDDTANHARPIAPRVHATHVSGTSQRRAISARVRRPSLSGR